MPSRLAQRYTLSRRIFIIKTYNDIPVLLNGKYDFKRILMDEHEVSSSSFLKRVMMKATDILELNETEWTSVLDMFRQVLSKPSIEPMDNFKSLEADSLSFVTISVELESCLEERMLEDWQELSITVLGNIYTECLTKTSF